MDRKIKLLVASIVTVMATGCSYQGAPGNGSVVGDSGGYNNGGGFGANQSARGGQVAGGSQVSRGGLFGQRRSSTCAPCNANAIPKSTYTYKPAPKPAYRAAPKPAYRAAPRRQAGQHSQQYYIDRWNRQQSQQRQRPRAQAPRKATNYTGYGNGGYNANTTASSTNYYDYSSASKTAAPAATPAPAVSASNKSIYTGSYQQPTYKPYQPTTYSGGSAATTTTTNTTYTAASANASGGSSYAVKKGDTVFEVMRQTGVYWKDIIKLNNLTAPYTISPGQRLRLK